MAHGSYEPMLLVNLVLAGELTKDVRTKVRANPQMGNNSIVPFFIVINSFLELVVCQNQASRVTR